MDIPDGDLVRLARDGDPAAFRLLVERHLPMARARAARLCDPDRFAAWLVSSVNWSSGTVLVSPQPGHGKPRAGHARLQRQSRSARPWRCRR